MAESAPPAGGRTPAVLLISPGVVKPTDRDFGLPHLVSLGGYVRHHLGVRVEILDLGYEGGDHEALRRTIDELGPLICVGISCYSSYDYLRVMALGRFLRLVLPDVPLVTGGYHASAVPDDLDFDGSPFDAVVVGEGERPLRDIVETLLGGGRIARRYGPDNVVSLDELPPYDWALLDRYWPRATEIGRKLQVVLSRGCVYRCAFCMERAKTDYRWRAYGPERAVDELARLARFADLGEWVVNIADPLFGFERSWRRHVLSAVVERGLIARQYWTLTRSDDLGDEDVALLARARFSIGIGLESGSPDMLVRMNKARDPERYLGAVRSLAERSRVHGLSWAANVIVGHPGETRETMRETRDFVAEVFAAGEETCGWLSIDPFRLYPGSLVHLEQARFTNECGSVFHADGWWRRWYDGAFRAEHIDPSGGLDFADRVRYMHEAYPPLVARIRERFRGQGRGIDRVFARSLAEQERMLSDDMRDRLLRLAARARTDAARVSRSGAADAAAPTVEFPIGLRVRDPLVRRRESAVRHLLQSGGLRTGAVVEALLRVDPCDWLEASEVDAMLSAAGRPDEGRPARHVALRALAVALEALDISTGDHVAHWTASSGYATALLVELVGDAGRVTAVVANETARGVLADRFPTPGPVTVVVGDPTAGAGSSAPRVDRVLALGAFPRVPGALSDRLHAQGGCAVLAVGPRFRPQDLVVVHSRGANLDVRRIVRVRFPPLRGQAGWLRPVASMAAPAEVAIRFERARHVDVFYTVLAALDLGRDAASLFDPTAPRPDNVELLRRAYDAAPGRLFAHALPLVSTNADHLRRRLEAPPKRLADAGGRALCAELREAFEAAWDGLPPHMSTPRELSADLVLDLQQYRTVLWARIGRSPPPALIYDCPVLGPHGRAATLGGARRIAVSLGPDADRAFCQIAHEETHAVSDRAFAAAPRSTTVGADGHAHHLRLEQAAIDTGLDVVNEAAPSRIDAYRRWAAEHGVELA